VKDGGGAPGGTRAASAPQGDCRDATRLPPSGRGYLCCSLRKRGEIDSDDWEGWLTYCAMVSMTTM
jgi:hypothetical protein